MLLQPIGYRIGFSDVDRFFGKIANEYRWQIIVRSPDPAALARGLPLRGWQVDVDPLSLL